MLGVYKIMPSKDYYSKHKEILTNKRKAYYSSHKEVESSNGKAYRKEHRSGLIELKKRWDEAHRQEAKEYQKAHRYDRKILVISQYGGKCACCGLDQIDALTIDHINGGGNKHRKEVGGTNGLYKWLVQNNFPEGFQVLCSNCNLVKSIRGVCTLDHSK
jgi:hypothetical protein